MRSAGGPSTSVAVPTIADMHHGVTSEQLRSSIPSLADRKSSEALLDAYRRLGEVQRRLAGKAGG